MNLGTGWGGVAQQWHHWAWTRQGNSIRIYQNGTQLGSVACSGTLDNTAGSKIAFGGAYVGNGNGCSYGYYDDIRLRLRELTN